MHLVKVKINSEAYPNRRHYPFNIPVLRATPELTFKKPVAFFVGENGSGKSTLLYAITRKCGIHVWDKPRRHLAHNNPYEDRLSDFLSVTWANGGAPGSLFRAETFYELADFLDDVALCDPGRLQYQGGRILNTLSHGEGMLAYFSGRYHIKGLYILDEPEAALSPASQVRFVNLTAPARGGGSCPVHNRHPFAYSVGLPGSTNLQLRAARVEEVAYEDTAHYRIYKQFFTDRSAILEA